MRLNKSRSHGDVPASTEMGLTDLRRQKDVSGDILKRRTNLRRYKDIPWDLGFMNVKSLLAWTVYFQINRILVFSRILLSDAILYNWRLTFPRWLFSIWKPSKTYTWRWSTYILIHSNVKHSSQNTVYRRTMQHDVAICTWIKRTYLWRLCDVSLVGR